MSKTINKLTVSYAQNFEDVLLWRVFKNQSTGFYVDVGAAHPIKDSVTYLFYLKGWRGINIEPNPFSFSLLQKNRSKDINLSLAISDKEGEAQFQFVENDPHLSSLGKIPENLISENKLKIRKMKIKITTLSKIYKENNVKNIDFLKIDVEGFEKNVLAGAHLELYKPRVLIIESVSPKSDKVVRDGWLEILNRNQYRLVYFDGINDYFVQDSDLEAIEAFRLPLNIKDQFIRADFLKKKFLFRIFFNI